MCFSSLGKMLISINDAEDMDGLIVTFCNCRIYEEYHRAREYLDWCFCCVLCCVAMLLVFYVGF